MVINCACTGYKFYIYGWFSELFSTVEHHHALMELYDNSLFYTHGIRMRVRMCICVHVRCTWAFRFRNKVKICILRPYLEHFTYIVPIFNQRWANPREKTPNLSVQKFGISHVPRARLEHFLSSVFVFRSISQQLLGLG